MGIFANQTTKNNHSNPKPNLLGMSLSIEGLYDTFLIPLLLISSIKLKPNI